MVKDHLDFPEAREAYRNSLHRLQKEKVDVFIGNHVWNNNTEEYLSSVAYQKAAKKTEV